MNRVAATSDTSPSTLPIFFLLLSYCISGVEGYRVEAPSRYTALQGHLTVTVYLTSASPTTDAPLYTWDFDNNLTYVLNNSIIASDSNSNDPVDPSEYDVEKDEAKASPKPLEPLPVFDISREPDFPKAFEETATTEDIPPEATLLTLSLFANGSSKPIKTYPIAESVEKVSFVFPCGLVVQGGIHFFRLERGEEVLALSGDVEVEWPQMTLEVPSEVETYHTPVQVILRFTGSMCHPSSNIDFSAWVDLLYHGVPVGIGNPVTSPTQSAKAVSNNKLSWNRSLWNSYQEDRNRRALKRFRNIVRGKRKDRRNKRKKKKIKNRKNGRRRTRKKGRYDVEGDVLEKNRTEESKAFLDDSVNSTGSVVSVSTKTIVDDDSTNSTNLELTNRQYVNKTKDNEELRRGIRKGKRRKGASERKKNRKETIEKGRDPKTDISNNERKSKKTSNKQMNSQVKRRRGRQREGLNKRPREKQKNENNKTRTEFPEPLPNAKPKKEVILTDITLLEQEQSKERIELSVITKNVNISLENEEMKPEKEEQTPSSVRKEETSSESLVPKKQILVSEDEIPGREKHNPLFQEHIPVLEDEIPDRQEQIPVLDDEIPDHQEQIPVLEDEIPGRQEHIPIFQVHIPVLEDQVPGRHDQLPAYQDEIPVLDVQVRKEQISILEEQIAGHQEQLPESQEHIPNLQERISLSNEQISGIPEQVIASSKQTPASGEQILATQEQTLQKNKRAIVAPDIRLYRSSDFKHPPQAAIVASGSRGGGWAWGGGAVILGRVPLGGSLYSHPSHEIKFPCTTIGPAGLYSVRLATDIPTSKVIATSEWFTVVWSDSFSLYVHAASIQPCVGPIGVRLSYPTCIGRSDKVRVYARIRTNVTSYNPPTVNKYVSERRVIKGRTSVEFPCTTFFEDATEFCFVYINTAKTGQVSTVVKQCIPTYKPNGLREVCASPVAI